MYGGYTYPSAFHLLEALRFLDDNPDVAERIRHCQSVPEVRDTVAEHYNVIRPDWEVVVVKQVCVGFSR